MVFLTDEKNVVIAVGKDVKEIKNHYIIDSNYAYQKPLNLHNEVADVIVQKTLYIDGRVEINPDYIEPDPLPEPEPITPSPTEQKLAALQAENETLMLALAEQYEKQLTVEANQQTIMLALADLYETNTNAV